MAIAPAHRPLEARAASLLDIDAELGDTLDPRHLAEARARAVVAVVDLPSGPWSPAPIEELGSRPFAILVVDGLLVREVLLAGSTATELLGPGDLVDFRPADDALLPTTIQWSVPEAAEVAIIDDRILAMLRSWPLIGRILLERAARRAGRLATHRAIAQLPRVDERLLALFGHVAEHWGRVGTAGMVIPLHLTHETLGRLIGARRPTVSLALKELSTAGMLERRADGAWLLHREAFEALATDPGSTARWQPADARALAPDEEEASDSRRAMGAPAGLRPADVEALADRVAFLHAEHAARVARCTSVLETARATRRAMQAERRSGGGGFGPVAAA
ncbi:MAG TPA: helix-turn-helix domain-containing protein [Solirubrobacteraceae bacterium]|nr:helix-turn-helix domain-containing protein [Solirubrobacteraceae bacterium]